jgi:pre-mRNA-splicing factor ISY1
VGRSRTEIYKNIDADYYGYRDEEDGLLLESEKQQEALLIEKLSKQHNADSVDVDGDKQEVGQAINVEGYLLC